MSWKDEEIDNLFKSNSEKLTFEYKDAYWKEMEAMLPKKKNRDFLWFFTASSFAGLLLMGMFYSPAGSVKSTQLAENNTTNSRTSPVVASQGLGEMDSHSSLHSNRAQDVQQSVDLKEKQSLVVSNQSASALNNNNANSAVSSKNALVQTSQSPKRMNNESVNSINSVQKNASIGNENIAKNLNQINKNQLNKQVAMLQIPAKSTVNLKANNSFVNVDNLPLRDVAQFSIERNLDIIPIQPVEKAIPLQTRFYVEAIGGITQSLVTPSDKIGSSYGLGLGVQLTKKRWNFTFGVNGLVGNYNDIQLTRIAKYYSFGSTEVQHNLDYHNLYSIEGNFSAGFMLGRHELSLGIRPSFVASSKVDYERNSEGTMMEKKAFIGYMEGVNRFGLKPTFGYTYHFKKGWQLGLRGGVQLFDSFESEYIQKENAKFPIDGQLFLRKTFNFKRK